MEILGGSDTVRTKVKSVSWISKTTDLDDRDRRNLRNIIPISQCHAVAVG